MKKVLCFAAAALVLFAGCQKTTVVYDNDTPEEISFVAANQTATKTPVDGETFLDGDNMAVAAYIVNGSEADGNFFGYTLFNKTSDHIWSGSPARYWPLTTSTINFLAVTEIGGGVDDKITVTFDNPYASGAEVVLAENNVLNQNDLMFAAGTGTHTEGGDYNAVSMVFKHALSWINFNVKTGTPSYDGLLKKGCDIQINSITLNGAAFNGTLRLQNGKYNEETANTTSEVIATWSNLGTANRAVPNAEGTAAADAVVLNNTSQPFGNGLLVIPGTETSFTINYTLTQSDGTVNTYDYTYIPQTPGTWEMAKKYFYNINITLSEIQITPSVTDWDPQAETNVPLN